MLTSTACGDVRSGDLPEFALLDDREPLVAFFDGESSVPPGREPIVIGPYDLDRRCREDPVILGHTSRFGGSELVVELRNPRTGEFAVLLTFNHFDFMESLGWERALCVDDRPCIDDLRAINTLCRDLDEEANP